MSYFKWNLNLEDGDGIEPDDPLGEIAIIGDRGQIEDKCIFLDTFFGALVKGIQLVEKGKIIEIDSIDEPDDIVFDYTGENLTINYGKQQTIIFDKNRLITNMQEAVKNFLCAIDNASIEQKETKRKLPLLRDFIHIRQHK